MIEDSRLRIFKTVATKGSFTLAARALRISQPAVSQNIAELERNLGKELFHRSKGSVTLTEAGNAFLEYADKILYWYDAADNLFGKNPDTHKKTLKIASETFLSETMLNRITETISVASGETVLKISDARTNGYDIKLYCDSASKDLSIEESSKVLASLNAVAVSSDEKLSRISLLQKLPQKTCFAVWSGYESFLPAGIAAKTSIYSDSTTLIYDKVSSSPEIIGLVPDIRVPEKLYRLPMTFSTLGIYVMMDISETFTDRSLAGIIRKSLSV